jgi:parallel beta-helix repeat protein
MNSKLLPAALAAAATLAVCAPAQAVTVVGPRDSIQAAVDAARPGDTVVVKGFHRENVAIGKDRLTLRGVGAVLEPPAVPAANACFDPTVAGEAVHGICASGDIDFETGAISRYVHGVTVRGFTVRGFTGHGISVAAARSTTVADNVVEDNRDAGVAVIVSTDTRLRRNHASGSRFGVYIGSAVGGELVRSSLHDNCVGMLVADSLGPAGGFRVAANRVTGNTRVCPAGGDWPALSGAGVALLGAVDNSIVGNRITGNVPADDTAVAGGVAVLADPSGAPSSGNLVAGNRLRDNDPDLFWDGAGSGNVFR